MLKVLVRYYIPKDEPHRYDITYWFRILFVKELSGNKYHLEGRKWFDHTKDYCNDWYHMDRQVDDIWLDKTDWPTNYGAHRLEIEQVSIEYVELQTTYWDIIGDSD